MFPSKSSFCANTLSFNPNAEVRSFIGVIVSFSARSFTFKWSNNDLNFVLSTGTGVVS
ncbi:MAG: hypothetical protein IPJ43_08020 [Saprospiraceae bacterium]|nr:hypothetical protein [Saprospiraceae bacterium]